MSAPLRPEHAADLARSGLTPEDAAAAGIVSRDAGEVSVVVGFPVTSAGYLIPFPGTSGVRVRLMPPHVFSDGKAAKYLSPKGGAVRLYLPPGVVEELRADPARTLYVVEGEKKALSMRKHLGVCVVGLAGVDAWNCKARPSGVLEDLEELRPRLRGRRVVITFDSDARTNHHVAGAAHRLASWLHDEAAAVPSWAFPESDGDAKVGMDDLIVAKGVEAARAVLEARIDPADPACFVFREAIAAAKVSRPGRAFVGTALAQRLREVLRVADAGVRRALADEAKHELGLTAGDRDALLDGLATQGTADDGAQGNAVAFSDPTPWPDAVDGVVLFDEVLRIVRRYLVLPTHADVALVLWVAYSWAFDCFYHAPRLALTSPTRRCGKSTVLVLLKALVRRALLAANVTPSVVFRAVEAHQPTLLIDEWDSFADGKEELRNVVNAGHTRDGVVMRSDGETLDPRAFNVWSPAAVAAIGRLPATITDRSVEVPMRRKKKSERVTRLRGDRIQAELEPLRRRLARWASDQRESLAVADPAVPESLDDRAADNWRPLIAVADAVGGVWPELGRRAALALSAGRDVGDDESLGGQLVRDCRVAFGSLDRIPSSALAQRLIDMEDRPWAEVGKNEKPLTVTGLARMLRPFGISPQTIRVSPTQTAKGYHRESFADAWATYTPAEAEVPAVTPSQANVQRLPEPLDAPSRVPTVTTHEAPPTAEDASRVTRLRPTGREAPDLPVGALFDIEERAAIREHDGHQPRDLAERAARDEIERGRP